MRRSAIVIAALGTASLMSACEGGLSREHFGLVYETGYGEKVDTFEGIVTKDMVNKPDTTINLSLTEGELDVIYAKTIEVGFFNLPEPHPPQDEHTFVNPHTTYKLTIRAGKRLKSLEWDTRSVPAKAAEAEWKSIYGLLDTIRGIIESRPEYQSLPEPTAGYL